MRFAEKYGLVAMVVFSLLLCAAPALGEEGGHVSQAALAAFGIGGLQPMSDAESHTVRGEGFVWVGSFSFALGDFDPQVRSSSGVPRIATSSASGSARFGGFRVRASSSGFAFAASR